MRELWLQDGLTQVELSQKIRLERGAVNSLIDGMTRLKLITRRRNRTDRRKVNVFFTEKGDALKHELRPCVARVNEAAAAGLSAVATENFHQTVTAMVTNLTELQHRRKAAEFEEFATD